MEEDPFKEMALGSKQEELHERSHQLVEELIYELNEIKSTVKILGDTADLLTLQELFEREKFMISTKPNISGIQKEFLSLVSKSSKAVDKELQSNLPAAVWDVQYRRETINDIILAHLYHEGEFALGDLFAAESGISSVDTLKQPYLQMHAILEEIRQKNLYPALTWFEANGSRNYPLLFKLHQLQFVGVLQTEGIEAALQYARHNIGTFGYPYLIEIQKTMSYLLWDKGSKNSSFVDLGSDAHRESVEQEFIAEFCHSISVSPVSPLLIAVNAGAIALPVLLKMASIISKKQENWQELKELPMEIDLGKEFQFQSVFACPVSKEQSSIQNPPMLMNCGHVLCKQSILKLVPRGAHRTIKCPYCPVETKQADCRPIHF